MSAFFCVVELEGLVTAGGEEEFAGVVEGEGCCGGFGLAEFEELRVGVRDASLEHEIAAKRSMYLGWP